MLFICCLKTEIYIYNFYFSDETQKGSIAVKKQIRRVLTQLLNNEAKGLKLKLLKKGNTLVNLGSMLKSLVSYTELECVH